MIDTSAVNTVIRGLVQELLGLADGYVRPANTTTPTGNDPFATVLITSLYGPGSPDLKRKNEPEPSVNVKETVTQQVVLTASLQFFGPMAVGYGQRTALLLRSSLGKQLTHDAGLGLVKTSPVKDLAALVSSEWEGRCQLDLVFHVIDTEILSLPTVGTFPIHVYSDSPNNHDTVEVHEP